MKLYKDVINELKEIIGIDIRQDSTNEIFNDDEEIDHDVRHNTSKILNMSWNELKEIAKLSTSLVLIISLVLILYFLSRNDKKSYVIKDNKKNKKNK